MSSAAPRLSLAFGFRFEDLYSVAGLARLDGEFVRALAAADAALAERFAAARHDPAALAYREEAELLIAAAPHLDRFVARLFAIEEEWEELVESHHLLAPLFRVKRKFVQRRAMLKIKAEEAAKLDGPALEARVAERLGGAFDELAFANAILAWLKDEAAHADDLALAERFSAWAAHTDEGRWRHRGGVLFKPPQRVDPLRLVPVQTDASRGYSASGNAHIEGCACSTVGLRDLFPPYALESIEPAPAAAASRNRQAGSRRRHGARGLHARAPPHERRPRRDRHRRPQDRTIGRVDLGRGFTRQARLFPPDSRHR